MWVQAVGMTQTVRQAMFLQGAMGPTQVSATPSPTPASSMPGVQSKWRMKLLRKYGMYN